MSSETIKEFIRKFGEECVSEYIRGHEGALAINGHWLWLRKCGLPKIMIDTPEGEKEFFVPNKSADTISWYQVIAKGCRVGKRREMAKDTARRLGLSRNSNPNHFVIGDIILIPTEHPWGIKTSPWDEKELLVDESLPVCRVED